MQKQNKNIWFYARNRNEWRKWLEKNYSGFSEINLIYYRKESGKPCITYDDSVEEALCFGWIDGRINKIDEEKYCRRFSPRKSVKSAWSLLNKQRAEKMMKENKMTEAGMKTIIEAKASGFWDNAYSMRNELEIPADMNKALIKNKRALENFNKAPNSTKFIFVTRVNKVKDKKLRAEKIKEVIGYLENNIRPSIDLFRKKD